MQKVILDTNIFVAAGFNPGSRSASIVAAVEAGEIEMVWDEATRAETRRILKRIPPLHWDEFSKLFREEAKVANPKIEQKFDAVPDPDDRKLAALAHATGATLISNDDHLLSVRDQLNLPVMTPEEFYRQYPSPPC